MKKNILAIILISVICLSMFSACELFSDDNNTPNNNATTVSGAQVEKETTVSKPKKTVIKYVTIDPDTVTDSNGVPVTDKEGNTMTVKNNKDEETTVATNANNAEEKTNVSKQNKKNTPKATKTKKVATTNKAKKTTTKKAVTTRKAKVTTIKKIVKTTKKKGNNVKTTKYTFETAENGDIWSPAY